MKPVNNSISPYREVLGFEFLYARKDSSAKKIADRTVAQNTLPSDVSKEIMGFLDDPLYDEVENLIKQKIGTFEAIIAETFDYPSKLKDSESAQPVLYSIGDIGLLSRKAISIVGTRNATSEGIGLARWFARELVKEKYTIVSGLAKGIDTAAMAEALKHSGSVVGVIGTPIDQVYPITNRKLQVEVAEKGLLLSQVPFYKYSMQPFKTKRFYFVERNETMSAISNATIIIEASETSGTRVQARACINQGRPLFFTSHMLRDPRGKWAEKYVEMGARVVDSPAEMIEALRNA